MPIALAERREYNGYVIEQELDDYFSEVRGKEATMSEATKGGVQDDDELTLEHELIR